MKQLITSLFVCAVLSIATPKASYAAFPVKESKIETVTTSQVTTTDNTVQEITSAVESQKTTKADGSAKITKGIYILLAFLGLGWLAMGLNDDFGGSDWLISLLLYCLLWLPGFIYSLVKMKKYY